MPSIPIGALPKRPKRRSFKTVRHSVIDHLLAAAGGRDEYEALLLDPRTTAEDARAWLASRGHEVSKSAVDRHRRHFLIAREAARRQADEARAVATALAGVFNHFAPGQAGQFLLHSHQFLLFKRLMEMDQEEFSALPVKELRELSELVFHTVRAQSRVMDPQPAAAPPAAGPDKDGPS